MNPDEHSTVWRDTVNDAVSPEFAAESLARMLNGARGKRHRRRVTKGVASAAFILTAVFLMQRTAPQTPAPQLVEAHPAAPRAPEVKMLTDDELFAQFPGRAMALVTTGDTKRLVFLDTK